MNEPVSRWVKIKGVWVHIMMDDDNVYIDGEKCEYREEVNE